MEKSELRLWGCLHLWKNWFTFVGGFMFEGVTALTATVGPAVVYSSGGDAGQWQ